MAPYVTQITEFGQQLPDDGFCLPTVRTLEVAVLDEGHVGVRRAADVVPVGIDGIGEVHDGRGLAEERSGAKRRGQVVWSISEHQPGEQGRHHGGGEHAERGLLQLDTRERDRGDEQRDGEAHPRQGAAAQGGHPAHRRTESASVALLTSADMAMIPAGFPTT